MSNLKLVNITKPNFQSFSPRLRLLQTDLELSTDKTFGGMLDATKTPP
jgi:hypothetical protein